MANHSGRPPGGRYGEVPGPEIYGNDSVGLFSPWTGRDDHGGQERGQVPLSLSRPAIALLCFTFHLLVLVAGTRLVLFLWFGLVRILDTSISDTHVYVGRVETAGVNNNAGWALNPFRRCPAHSTSWQAGCAVCDRALSFPPISTADVPESLATSVRSIKRESTESNSLC